MRLMVINRLSATIPRALIAIKEYSGNETGGLGARCVWPRGNFGLQLSVREITGAAMP